MNTRENEFENVLGKEELFPAVNATRGAPMGRRSSYSYQLELQSRYDTNPDAINAVAVNGTDPEDPDYDVGGAYWGSEDGTSIFAVFNPIDIGHDPDAIIYVRAYSEEDAIRQALYS